VPVLLPARLTEATSLGAGIAGGLGVRIFDSFAVTDRFIQAAVAAQPEPITQAHCAELGPLYRAAYCGLEPIFSQLH